MRTDRYKTDSRRKRGIFGKKSLTTVFVLALSVILMVGCVVGTTLAWLTDKTEPVTNTFTYGDINITLDETTTNFKMVPGETISKDPKVTVEADSEDCWLFVEIQEGGSVTVGSQLYCFDNFISYVVDSSWTKLEQDPKSELAFENEKYVYYCQVSASDKDQEFEVLENNQVTVLDAVTKEMFNAFDDDKNGEISEEEKKDLPSLTFTAYAIQQASFEDAATAWAEINNK